MLNRRKPPLPEKLQIRLRFWFLEVLNLIFPESVTETESKLRRKPDRTYTLSVGDEDFLKVVSNLGNLHVLRISNNTDPVPLLPKSTILAPYVDVGEKLMITTLKSPYLKHTDSEDVDPNVHSLEV